ncbi:DNA ligase [Bajunvirus bajun]|uniref:DNA ligase n=1 Tax=Brevundimonas phage vB_BgoS-Bajun TaxID=2948594 RepID=A0A9E7N712_9CAUD|nr:DNA ligase [Brevundimonas phage vB_BgoS-Bajun]
MPKPKTPKPPKPFKPFGRFRIMLADTDAIKPADFDKLTYPLLGSLKKDGIRAAVSPIPPADIDKGLVHTETGWKIDRAYLDENGAHHAITRAILPVANRHARALLETLPPGTDGEIGVMIDGVLNFRASTSAIMTQDGEPDIRFFVFDNFLAPGGKLKRYQALCAMRAYLPSWVVIVEQVLLTNADEARAYYFKAVEAGEEGVIFCSIEGPYKPNRSTFKEGWMLKGKEKASIEITVTGVEEEFENTNEKKLDERGLAKRSTHKENKVGKGVMGVLLGTHPDFPGKIIRVGSGFDAKTKKEYWLNPPLGQLATIEYVVAGGYDVPRNTSFKGLRDPRDLS